MSRYGTDTKERVHIGTIQQNRDGKLLVISVTYDYKCPFCSHDHFEIIGYGLFRCFMCSTSFLREELIKK